MKNKNTSQAFQLTITAFTGRQYVPYLRKYLPVARRLARGYLRTLSLVLVGDKRMSVLHEKFMQVHETTDVMTFPIESDAANHIIEGEVVICVSEARRQAKVRGTTVANELLLYSLHGLLHLNGLDDRTEKQYKKMHACEDEILIRLGVGKVFSGSNCAE